MNQVHMYVGVLYILLWVTSPPLRQDVMRNCLLESLAKQIDMPESRGLQKGQWKRPGNYSTAAVTWDAGDPVFGAREPPVIQRLELFILRPKSIQISKTSWVTNLWNTLRQPTKQPGKPITALAQVGMIQASVSAERFE